MAAGTMTDSSVREVFVVGDNDRYLTVTPPDSLRIRRYSPSSEKVLGPSESCAWEPTRGQRLSLLPKCLSCKSSIEQTSVSHHLETVLSITAATLAVVGDAVSFNLAYWVYSIVRWYLDISFLSSFGLNRRQETPPF